MKKKRTFFRGKQGILVHSNTNKNKPKTNQNPPKKLRRVYGQVRWPKGPPHLTLKPFQKKNKSKNKRTNKTQQLKQNKQKTNQKQNK